MKKTICILLLLALLSSIGCVALAEEPEIVRYENAGIAYEDPVELRDCTGVAGIDSYGCISYDPPCYVILIDYVAMTRENYDEIMAKYLADEASDEELDSVYQSMITLGGVAAVQGELEDAQTLLTVEMGDAFEIGTAEDFHFYYFDIPCDVTGLEPVFAEEIGQLKETMPEVFRKAELSVPADPLRDLIDTKISFTAVDLDGNEHSSEELFSANRYTMINCWGTWCGHCVDELADLAELDRAVKELGGGIVGIEREFEYDEETLQRGRDVLAANGVTYPNVLAKEDIAFVNELSGFPTSIFVNQEGEICAPPISAVDFPGYLSTFEELLGAPVEMEWSEEPEEEDAGSPDAAANGEEFYRVFVMDSEGPVQGATVQFCSSDTCVLGKTDAEGAAVFEMPDGEEYTVHILKVPKGYAKPAEEFTMLAVHSDLTVQIEKAA